MRQLFQKYNVQAPRYTSYPAMPYWKNNIDQVSWLNSLKKEMKNTIAVDLYIHIPFCEKLCWYCGCNRVITKDKNEGDTYLDALLAEFSIYTKELPDLRVQSLHLGGGTPNFLTPTQMERMLKHISPFFSKTFEGAIEIDPRTCNEEQLEILSKFGFGRISFGIQDFDQKVQMAINRIQSVELVEKLYQSARRIGFKHFNFDLIWGLPKQTTATIKRTIEITARLAPEQISFYSYAHLPSHFKHQRLIKDEDILQGEAKRELYDTGKEELIKAGYFEIGMDHYAKKESFLIKAFNEKRLMRNFMGYTDKKTDVLIGLGASAISNASVGFVQNDKDVKRYKNLIHKNILPIMRAHKKEKEDALREKLIQSFMCNLKIDLTDLEELHNSEDIKVAFKEFIEDKLLTEHEGRYQVTTLGRMFIRSMASVLDEYFQYSSDEKKFSLTV